MKNLQDKFQSFIDYLKPLTAKISPYPNSSKEDTHLLKALSIFEDVLVVLKRTPANTETREAIQYLKTCLLGFHGTQDLLNFAYHLYSPDNSFRKFIP